MDFDELFGGDHQRRRHKHGHRHHGHDDRHDHHDDDHDARYAYQPRDHEHDEDGYRSGRHDDHGHHSREFDLEHVAHRILANKKLLIIAALVLVVVLVLAAIFLLPLLGDAVDFVDKSGVKGVIDRVWQGGGGSK